MAKKSVSPSSEKKVSKKEVSKKEVSKKKSEGKPLIGPLTMYVAWHPESEDGQYLAKEIYDWFRKPSKAVERSGAGVPVYYRSAPWSTTPEIGEDSAASPFLRDISYEHAAINVVIPLVDEHMVDDVEWRRWLYEVGELHENSPKTSGSSRQVLMIPVQLHSSISRLAPVISGINAVRLDRWDDNDDGPDGPDKDDGLTPDQRRRSRRGRRVRRYLVQTLVRELRERRSDCDTGYDLLPRSIFLSHAKMDRESGVGVAEKIRVEALSQGQIDTFFDTTELPWAAPWKKPMMSAAEEHTAAFIAVFGDAYASRYWCREEIRSARSPRRLEEKEHGGLAARVWWVQPTVIVDTLEKEWTRLLPEMSNAPVIRWRDHSAAVAEILDQVMLEALRAEIQARHALILADHIQDRENDGETLTGLDLEHLHFLTWVPDPFTLMEWLQKFTDTKRADAKGALQVVYPGHGLAQVDELRLQSYGEKTLEFLSVEELILELKDPGEGAGPPDEWIKPADRPLVALSVGDPDVEELHALGYGPEHLDDAVFRIATALISSWSRLVYGGVLRAVRQQDSFLEALLDVVAMNTYRRDGGDDEKPLPPNANPETLLRSYQSWDFYKGTGAKDRASQHGLCTFVPIDPEGLPGSEEQVHFSPTVRAYWRCRALSTMRKKIAEDAQALVAFGGKVHGWSGMAPGVIEEVCAMHRAGKPVLVLSAFGGAARRLVAWILDDHAGDFDLLDLEKLKKEKRNANLRRVVEGWEEASPGRADEEMSSEYEKLRKTIRDFRTEMRARIDPKGDRNGETYAGLSGPDLRELMTTSSLSTIRHLITHQIAPDLLESY